MNLQIINLQIKIHKIPENFENILINNLNFSYPGTAKKIFENLNININKGECIGIFGESGSGKSTLIDIITGLISCGEVKF